MSAVSALFACAVLCSVASAALTIAGDTLGIPVGFAGLCLCGAAAAVDA